MVNDSIEKILLSLTSGLDPKTGLSLESKNPLLEQDVQQALGLALETIKNIKVQRMKLPLNTGKAWTNEDDVKLVQVYDQGLRIEQISKIFKRTNGSIRARLIKLGKIEDSFER